MRTSCNKKEDYFITYHQNRENQKLIKENEKLKMKIEKALNKINNMFEVGDEERIIDDLLELIKILNGGNK